MLSKLMNGDEYAGGTSCVYVIEGPHLLSWFCDVGLLHDAVEL
jgi:hypothetical protein